MALWHIKCENRLDELRTHRWVRDPQTVLEIMEDLSPFFIEDRGFDAESPEIVESACHVTLLSIMKILDVIKLLADHFVTSALGCCQISG